MVRRNHLDFYKPEAKSSHNKN